MCNFKAVTTEDAWDKYQAGLSANCRCECEHCFLAWHCQDCLGMNDHADRPT